MPLRALARLRHVPATAGWPCPDELSQGRCDAWLERVHGERLERIDAACADPTPESLAGFRGLDDELWALLLTQQYELYPNIRALLPDVPDPSLQALYNGTSGIPLARQSVAFYTKLRERYKQHLGSQLPQARLVDFGCGWGRLTRFLARDIAPGRLYGCDPVGQILDVCRQTQVPATLARSEFLPERLPFDESFDLAFAFSVFTHLSETAALNCIRALHAGLRRGGILVVTVRPPEYLELSDVMQPVFEALGRNWREQLDEPRHLFVPHAPSPEHPQYGGGEMHYGEAVITLPYISERWDEWFALLEVDELTADPYQLMLTMRRR